MSVQLHPDIEHLDKTNVSHLFSLIYSLNSRHISPSNDVRLSITRHFLPVLLAKYANVVLKNPEATKIATNYNTTLCPYKQVADNAPDYVVDVNR